MLRRVLAILVALGVCAAALRAEGITTVRVLPGARIDPTSERITIASVAGVDGPEGARVGAITLWTSEEGPMPGRIGVDRVRSAALAAARADRSLSWARMRIEGTSCEIIGEQTPAPAVREAPPPPPMAGLGPTVRDHIEAHLRGLFGVPAEELRIGFRDEDAELLALPVGERLCEVRVTGSSGRMPVSVTLYQQDRIERIDTLRVGVELRRHTAVATAGVERGRLLDPTVLTEETRWLGPDERVLTMAEAVGRVSRTRIRPGEAVSASSVEMPLATKRGQIVSVRSIVGGAVVKTRARALSAARDGELVELETLDRARRFVARMSGDARAVVAPAGGAAAESPATGGAAGSDAFGHISIGEPG